jgi:PAS domain S-box-containing protein
MPFGLRSEPAFWATLRNWRSRPVFAYCIAAGSVALATGLRWLMDDLLVEGVPFLTFFVAVVISTFAGGALVGGFATLASSVVAWFFFLPPEGGGFDFDYHQVASLAAFALVCAILIGLANAFGRANDNLLRVSQNLRTLVREMPIGILLADIEGRIIHTNPTLERQFGYQPGELIGKPIEALTGEGTSDCVELRDAFLRSRTARTVGLDLTLVGKRKDGSEVSMEVGLDPIAGEAEQAVLATVVDISDRVKAEQRQKLLVGELHHRAQNLLAVIDTVVKRSLAERVSVEEARDALTGRIRALSYSFAILRGAGQSSTFREIAENELEPFGDRVTIVADDIPISAEAAQDFALILHELATNAVKHGSLSVPSGTVRLAATLAGDANDRRFVVDWRETGGPAVVPKTRRGFGSIVLERTPKRFCDCVKSELLPDGLHYRLEGPLQNLEPRPPTPGYDIAQS